MTEWFAPEGISEQLVYSTIRVENTPHVGTGFFFHHRFQNGNVQPVIVTNKHVIRANKGKIVFHIGEGAWPNNKPSGGLLTLPIDDFPRQWISHPSPDVDLCGMFISGVHTAAEKRGTNIFYRALDESIIWPDEKLRELNAAEDVLMIGYPNGLWDEVNNLPLIRRGITSTHPAINYRGKPETVLDIAAFPGSSGSPVVLAQDFFMDKRGNMSLKQRTVFLGVLYAGPTITQQGEIQIRDIPVAKGPIPVTEAMMNLVVCHD